MAAFARRHPDIPGWDNQAIVDTWAEVLDGPPALAAVADIVHEVMAAGGRGLQARLLASATAAARSMSVVAALHPRVHRLLLGAGQPLVPEAQFAAALKSIPGSPPALAAVALRTWVGAWSTPARQQHEPGGCPFVFSPPALGTMKHLLGCEPLQQRQWKPPPCWWHAE